jgi:hypothetical protein
MPILNVSFLMYVRLRLGTIVCWQPVYIFTWQRLRIVLELSHVS